MRDDPQGHPKDLASSPKGPRPVSDTVAKAVPVDGADEAQLLAKAARGDADAFRILVDRHLSVVVAGARRLLNDASEAEDVAQETFVRLWQSADGLEIGNAGTRPWLRRVSRNLAIDRLRSGKRFDVVADVPEGEQDADQQRTVEDKEQSNRVVAALAELPDRQRVALVLFHFEGFTQAEIADKLACSVDAVESLLGRARRRLKTDLKDAWQVLLDHEG